MDPDKLRVVALTNSCEDYQGLHELVWYLNGREPESTEATRIAAASAVLRDLLKAGYVSLYSSVWASDEWHPVPPEHQLDVVADPAAFAAPPDPPGTYYSYASTDAGEQAYRALPASAFEGIVW